MTPLRFKSSSWDILPETAPNKPLSAHKLSPHEQLVTTRPTEPMFISYDRSQHNTQELMLLDQLLDGLVTYWNIGGLNVLPNIAQWMTLLPPHAMFQICDIIHHTLERKHSKQQQLHTQLSEHSLMQLTQTQQENAQAIADALLPVLTLKISDITQRIQEHKSSRPMGEFQHNDGCVDQHLSDDDGDDRPDFGVCINDPEFKRHTEMVKNQRAWDQYTQEHKSHLQPGEWILCQDGQFKVKEKTMNKIFSSGLFDSSRDVCCRAWYPEPPKPLLYSITLEFDHGHAYLDKMRVQHPVNTTTEHEEVERLLVDTGARVSMIPRFVCTKLALPRLDVKDYSGANGPLIVAEHSAVLTAPGLAPKHTVVGHRYIKPHYTKNEQKQYFSSPYCPKPEKPLQYQAQQSMVDAESKNVLGMDFLSQFTQLWTNGTNVILSELSTTPTDSVGSAAATASSSSSATSTSTS